MILRPMLESEFGVWQARSKTDYVRDLMSNFGYHDARAECEAMSVLAKVLPQGFNTPDHHFRLCEHHNQTLGYLWFSLEDGAAYLMDLLLLPAHQGQGLGKQVMQCLVKELQTSGVNELELRVAQDNPRAIRLYEQCGFRITGLNMHLALRR